MGDIRECEGEVPEPMEMTIPSSPPRESTAAIETLVVQLFSHMTAQGRPSAIHELTSAQRTRLFSLVEGDYQRFENPTANAVLFARQRHDLQVLCCNPVCQNLGMDLPSLDRIPSLSQEEVVDLLREATELISRMMDEVVDLGFPQTQAKTVLANPSQLFMLVSLTNLSRGLSDPQALFDRREAVARDIGTLVQVFENGLRQRVDISQTIRGRPNEESVRLLETTRSLLDRLARASTPEEFQQACIEVSHHVVALEEARQAETHEICQLTKTRFTQLQPYFVPHDISPNAHRLQRPPLEGTEAPWTDEVLRFHREAQPIVYLLGLVQNHLRPYLDGSVAPEAEDHSRAELCSWVVPKFRAAFPQSSLSDEEIERFVLSAYLREGARGLDLESLGATSRHFSEEAGRYGPEDLYLRDSSAHAPESRLAHEARTTAESHFVAYTEALKHSLRIDFRSLNLTDGEIELLARSTIASESFFLPANWRELAKSPTLPIKQF
jgi:hypothetical protein